MNVKNLSLAGVSLDLYFRYEPETVENAIADLFDMYVKGQIKPEVTSSYPLEQFQSALTLFGEKKDQGQNCPDDRGRRLIGRLIGWCVNGPQAGRPLAAPAFNPGF